MWLSQTASKLLSIIGAVSLFFDTIGYERYHPRLPIQRNKKRSTVDPCRYLLKPGTIPRVMLDLLLADIEGSEQVIHAP